MEDDVHQYLGPGPVNCTANDIRIAFARVTAINGQEYNSNDPILCDPGTTMQVNMTAFLEASSEKERGDVGIWIGNPGGDAKTGDTCNHYNLIPGSDGTVNGDGDACAGMKAPAKDQPDTTAVDLGPITVSCPTSGPIQVGGCVAWTVPGQDPSDPNDDLSQCPDNHDGTLPSGESTDFRASTVPGTPAKCNCDGFSVPVILAGKITIVKDAVPDHAQDFAYTATGNGMSGFTLDDDPASLTPTNTKVFSSLVPLAAGGSRTVTETPLPGGWVITNIVCTNTTGSTVQIGGDSDFDAGDNSVTVANLASAADITCTFTNTKQGSIKIVKDAQPNHEQDFSYTASGTGMTPSPFSLDDDADGTLSNEQLFSNLAPGGVRRVTEDTETGWTLTNIACTGNTASTVVIGAAGGFNAGDTFVDITLANGEDIVCTFTNTKQGSIKIVKDAVPDDAQDFSYTASGTGMTPSPFDLDDDADGTLSNEQLFSGLLPNGVRRVTEDTETGWTLTNIACTGNTNSTVVIGAAGGFNAGDTFVDVTIADGENIVCTFTNTKHGSIKIVKDTKNPETDAKDFAYSASGTGMTPSPFSLDDDADGTLSNEQLFSALLPNGTRTVSETVDPEWALTNIVCTGNTLSTVVIGAAGGFNAGDNSVNIGLSAGENIVCTFTNQHKARLTVEKQITVAGRSETFTISCTPGAPLTACGDLDPDFSLGDGGSKSSGFLLLPGTYTVCEADIPVNWSATATLNGGAVGLTNPDLPEDLGKRCVDVTVAYNEDKTLRFINDPPPEGDARTPGYWKNWSSCTGGKQWEKANALGPEGISKTLDGNLPIDLVGDFGTYNVTTCLQAFKILSMQDQSGKNQGGDGAYILARALLAAELNVKALVTPCSEAADAIEDGQILLGSTGGTLSDGTVVSAGDAANFTGSGTYWKGGKNAAALRAKALVVAGILDSFNNNLLCGP